MPHQRSKMREKIEEKPVRQGGWRVVGRLIPGLLVLLLAVFMAFFEQYFLPIRMPVVGARSPKAIRAPYDFVFDEQSAIEKVRKRELDDFIPIYAYDTNKSRQIMARWEEFFSGVEQCRQIYTTSPRKAKACARELFEAAPDNSALSELLKYPHLDKMKSMLSTSMAEQQKRGIVEEEKIPKALTSIRIRYPNIYEPQLVPLSRVALVSEAKKTLGDRLDLLGLSKNLRKALWEELTRLSGHNLEYSDENQGLLTVIEAQQSKRKQVLYQRGDLLVRRGQDVSLLDHYRVQSCLEKSRPDSFLIGSVSLWVGGAAFLPFFILTLVFIVMMQRVTWNDRSPAQTYLLVFFVLLAVLIVAKIIYMFTNLSGFAIPMGASGLIVALLINPAAGLLTALLTSIYTTFLTTLDMGLFIYYLVGSVLLVLVATRTSKRVQLLFFSLLVGLINAGLLVCMILLRDEFPHVSLLKELGSQAFASAPGAWLVAILFMPLGERLFHLATPDRLRELADLNHPLLKKLQEKAPGTYYHSLAVANLASAAAEAVKANVLLVRVGAYYHDIGKIMQPEYFIENQSNRDNPHDTIDPLMSYEIVKAHVTDGVFIADEYRLPKPVIDMVAEHHGTTVAEAFYSKVRQEQPDATLNRDFFRYDGPRPTTIEGGILMIADVAEALARVVKTTNPLEVREMIHKVIVNKFEDGQFNQCRLPTSTLSQIEFAIAQALLGIVHKRIEYPDTNSRKDDTSAP